MFEVISISGGGASRMCIASTKLLAVAAASNVILHSSTRRRHISRANASVRMLSARSGFTLKP